MIKIKNLEASIDDKTILKGIDLEIPAGEVHVIMGRNGSGKSTLANVIAGNEAYEVDDGSIAMNDTDITEMSIENRALEGIFLCFQYPVAIPGVGMAYFLRSALNAHRKHQGKDEMDALEFLNNAKAILSELGLDDSFLKRSINDGFSGGEKKKSEIEKAHESQIKQLEVISGLSADDAKEQLVSSLKDKAKADAMAFIQESVEEAKLTAQQEAKKIIINTIQRIGTEEAVDNCVSVFNIESDDVKGRIIGREGRNIRAIEAATGVEIIVDDTPEAIILSCFDSVRREIARLSLHKLVTDGRIHPARIEEVVRKTTKQIEQEIIEVGKRTVIDLGIHGLHPELIKMVGRMKYRSSYGQNLLQHSREVAKMCGVMAAELGLNPKLAKRAGLLHDIGKVPDAEVDVETPHAILGMQWAEKHGEKKEVCNAIGAHHDEIEMKSLLTFCKNINLSDFHGVCWWTEKVLLLQLTMFEVNQLDRSIVGEIDESSGER